MSDTKMANVEVDVSHLGDDNSNYFKSVFN